MNINAFDVLMLIARPAAGKSEVIRYLKNTPPADRLERFHLGRLAEIDDFPMLWTWFEEDDLLSQMGQPRLHSTPDGYFLHTCLWDVLIRRLELEYHKRQRDVSSSTEAVTTLVEFARGKEHGGFRQAFSQFTPDLLRRAAVLYINVSFAESLRKNRRRFNPDRPDSILEHGLADEKLERLYAESDWEELSGGAARGRLELQGVSVPFAVFENEDDVTTPGGKPLGRRLEDVLSGLWQVYQK